jgi:hypothetical protein
MLAKHVAVARNKLTHHTHTYVRTLKPLHWYSKAFMYRACSCSFAKRQESSWTSECLPSCALHPIRSVHNYSTSKAYAGVAAGTVRHAPALMPLLLLVGHLDVSANQAFEHYRRGRGELAAAASAKQGHYPTTALACYSSEIRIGSRFQYEQCQSVRSMGRCSRGTVRTRVSIGSSSRYAMKVRLHDPTH